MASVETHPIGVSITDTNTIKLTEVYAHIATLEKLCESCILYTNKLPLNLDFNHKGFNFKCKWMWISLQMLKI